MKLVLVEPRDDGGWRIKGGDPSLERPFVKLFDPEDVTIKLGRVKREIEARSADLLTGSLTASQMAREMDLPVPLVSNAFEQVAREIPELHEKITEQGWEKGHTPARKRPRFGGSKVHKTRRICRQGRKFTMFIFWTPTGPPIIFLADSRF